ncbi:MAG: hypothetical protein HQ490_01065 [Lutibacter sp.]|nr:hypothetical protein [Lutibacter sp.]
MKDKILVWVDSELKQFCQCYYLQKEIDADFFAIVDSTNKTRRFFENQNLVKFKKVWYYHDYTLPIKKPDLDYLSSFENKYDIELWKLAINDRIFYSFNDFYKFSKNEILSILENECRFFESVLNEIKPNYIILHEPYQHHDELFYELCKIKNIKILSYFFSTLGYRCEISQTVHVLDNLKNLEIKNNPRNFNELRNYLTSFKLDDKVTKQNKDPFGNKTNILNAAIDYLLKTKNENIKTHYSYFGRSKLKVLLNSISGSIKTKKRWNYLNKKLVKNPDYDTNFVYYPLHIEQERSTLIVTPFYTDDIEFIKNIVKSLPINYTLYVKEHPSQLTRHWRSKKFYDELSNIPNLSLIHPHVSSLELVKNCSLVITRSGTVALEAAFFEKPSITCADFDYTVLSSVERLKSIEDLPKLIRSCLKKKFNSDELDAYVSLVEKNTFEFDGSNFDINKAKKFFHGGRLVDVEITDSQMKEFLDENESELKILSQEMIKKINYFKNQI